MIKALTVKSLITITATFVLNKKKKKRKKNTNMIHTFIISITLSRQPSRLDGCLAEAR